MQNDVLNAYEGITFSTGIADHIKPVIAYGRSAEDTVYNQLFGYFKAMGCKYNPTTIRKGVERAMKLKDADTMSHEELFERAKKYIENGGGRIYANAIRRAQWLMWILTTIVCLKQTKYCQIMLPPIRVGVNDFFVV